MMKVWLKLASVYLCLSLVSALVDRIRRTLVSSVTLVLLAQLSQLGVVLLVKLRLLLHELLLQVSLQFFMG